MRLSDQRNIIHNRDSEPSNLSHIRRYHIMAATTLTKSIFVQRAQYMVICLFPCPSDLTSFFMYPSRFISGVSEFQYHWPRPRHHFFMISTQRAHWHHTSFLRPLSTSFMPRSFSIFLCSPKARGSAFIISFHLQQLSA